MAQARANGIDIEYETIGEPGDPTLLLIMGLGAQLIAWPDDLCSMLADRGYHVIRFDNRDVGLSTKFAGAGYTLDDMADDAVGLLDALGIDAAHVAGASMGGMIAQTLAIRHPDRVRSLCSIMSTTGAMEGFASSNEALTALIRPAAKSRAEAIENSIATSRIIGSTGFEVTDDELRARAERVYDRCFNPIGTLQQAMAIGASGDRTEALGSVGVPTLVIHGSVDPLIPPVGGELTAKAIPRAQLLVIEGMGHDLPRGAWPLVVDAFVANAALA